VRRGRGVTESGTGAVESLAGEAQPPSLRVVVTGFCSPAARAAAADRMTGVQDNFRRMGLLSSTMVSGAGNGNRRDSLQYAE